MIDDHYGRKISMPQKIISKQKNWLIAHFHLDVDYEQLAKWHLEIIMGKLWYDKLLASFRPERGKGPDQMGLNFLINVVGWKFQKSKMMQTVE